MALRSFAFIARATGLTLVIFCGLLIILKHELESWNMRFLSALPPLFFDEDDCSDDSANKPAIFTGSAKYFKNVPTFVAEVEEQARLNETCTLTIKLPPLVIIQGVSIPVCLHLSPPRTYTAVLFFEYDGQTVSSTANILRGRGCTTIYIAKVDKAVTDFLVYAQLQHGGDHTCNCSASVIGRTIGALHNLSESHILPSPHTLDLTNLPSFVNATKLTQLHYSTENMVWRVRDEWIVPSGFHVILNGATVIFMEPGSSINVEGTFELHGWPEAGLSLCAVGRPSWHGIVVNGGYLVMQETWTTGVSQLYAPFAEGRGVLFSNSRAILTAQNAGVVIYDGLLGFSPKVLALVANGSRILVDGTAICHCGAGIVTTNRISTAIRNVHLLNLYSNDNHAAIELDGVAQPQNYAHPTSFVNVVVGEVRSTAPAWWTKGEHLHLEGIWVQSQSKIAMTFSSGVLVQGSAVALLGDGIASTGIFFESDDARLYLIDFICCGHRIGIRASRKSEAQQLKTKKSLFILGNKQNSCPERWLDEVHAIPVTTEHLKTLFLAHSWFSIGSCRNFLWDINTCPVNISDKNPFASGGYHFVVLGEFRNSPAVFVVWKKKHIFDSRSIRKIMRYHHALQHPGMVSFLGFCLDARFGFISIWEFFNGNEGFHGVRLAANLNVTARIGAVYQLFSALAYLRQFNPLGALYHNDLRTGRNILISSSGDVKLIDLNDVLSNLFCRGKVVGKDLELQKVVNTAMEMLNSTSVKLVANASDQALLDRADQALRSVNVSHSTSSKLAYELWKILFENNLFW